MQSKWKWTKGRRQVLRRDRVIKSFQVCRDKLGFTPKQTRLLLKGAALEHDLADAERLYNQRRYGHA